MGALGERDVDVDFDFVCAEFRSDNSNTPACGRINLKAAPSYYGGDRCQLAIYKEKFI